MIHIIPHHIKKGSYVPWYSLFNFKDEFIIHKFDNKEQIERAILPESNLPYLDELIKQITHINPNRNDVVICDVQYFPTEEPGELQKTLKELSNKFKIKIVSVDDDNRQLYEDTEFYTIFSNKFRLFTNSINNNFNYYRYRVSHENYIESLNTILPTFRSNQREKKLNMIIGVDKLERFEVFKYVHNIELDKDAYLAYSGFTSNYDDSELSNDLLHWKNENIPTILDTSIEESEMGNVNPQIPPIPYCMNSYVSCILETQLMQSPEIHLSEKSWNPFISYNIPLILGGDGVNKYLKQLGFWLADDLFDTSNVSGKTNIINQYKSNLDILKNISKNELHDYYINNLNYIEHNFHIIARDQRFIYDLHNYKHHTYKEDI